MKYDKKRKDVKAVANPFEGDEEVDYTVQRAKGMIAGHLLPVEKYEGLFVETKTGKIVTMS